MAASPIGSSPVRLQGAHFPGRSKGSKTDNPNMNPMFHASKFKCYLGGPFIQRIRGHPSLSISKAKPKPSIPSLPGSCEWSKTKPTSAHRERRQKWGVTEEPYCHEGCKFLGLRIVRREAPTPSGFSCHRCQSAKGIDASKLGTDQNKDIHVENIPCESICLRAVQTSIPAHTKLESQRAINSEAMDATHHPLQKSWVQRKVYDSGNITYFYQVPRVNKVEGQQIRQ